MNVSYATLNTKTRVNLQYTLKGFKAELIISKGKSVEPHPAELSNINYNVILYSKIRNQV